MWADESVFYQIYPLGLCGAPFENDGKLMHRITKIEKWIPHFKKLNINAIYFSPVFESDTHGYNTRDYQKIDTRLGTNEDFANLCQKLHQNDIRVVLDGVFNHVGRGFFAFEDVLKYREKSKYVNWFARISFEGNSNYNDGLWYEGWEGNYDLVKLNLKNPDVVNYLFDSIRLWVKEFDIDGLRLDVAYCLDKDFIRQLRSFCDTLKPDFYLLGEMIHGDYNTLLQPGMLHSTTNYEAYKGIYSSFNDMNMFEINHSIIREFGNGGNGMYSGKNLLTFVDNHDVERLASVLKDPGHISLAFAFAFGMPGIPCIYYGSEWAIEGRKKDGDPALRPAIEEPVWNELSEFIGILAKARRSSKALSYGNFSTKVLNNPHCVFERRFEDEVVYVAINAKNEPATVHFDAGTNILQDLLTGDSFEFHNTVELEPYSAYFFTPHK